ncbi:MAG TPA: SPOR domain-containing protein [Polyangiaceae bacterium]|nr:SPOR domain-containing protein [Polyangiaceae bacterium]
MRLAAAASTAVLILVAVPGTAQACWDGYAASSARVTVDDPSSSEWSPELVRRVATWLARVEALLPPGDMVRADMVTVDVCHAPDPDGVCSTPVGSASFAPGSLGTLFTAVAGIERASWGDRRDALARRATVRTVQVFAAYDRATADRIAGSINTGASTGSFALGPGFIDVGGFPSANPVAHVVEARTDEDQPLYRVFVGAYVDDAAAREALAGVTAATGMKGFVRVL